MDIKELFLSLSNDEKQDFLDFATGWLEEWVGPMKDPDGDDDYVAPEYAEKLRQATRIMTDEKRDDMFNNVARGFVEDNAYDTNDADTIAGHYTNIVNDPEQGVLSTKDNYYAHKLVDDPSLRHLPLGIDASEFDDEEKAALMEILRYGYREMPK